MTDENLGNVLDESYRAHQKMVAVKNLGDRTHLTLGQIAKLCEHPQHGEIVASITLEELLAVKEAPDEVEEPDSEPESKKKASKKSSSKKKSKKASKKKSSSKKKSKKKASKKKSSSKKGAKADKGKPKPRLDYEKGTKEVLAALRAAKEPVGRSAIEKATGYSGVQVRAFAKKLAKAGKIKILGEGGRSTKYAAA